MKYGTLRQRNPAYTEARWEELGDLYVGGYAHDAPVQLIAHTDRFTNGRAARPPFLGSGLADHNYRIAARVIALGYGTSR